MSILNIFNLVKSSTPLSCNFSLRDGIKSKPSNWQNCSMFVQDIKSPEINITADIANKEAKHFKEMCRLFESDDSIETAIDEYLMKVQHKLCAASVIDLTVDLDTSEPPPAKRAALGNHEPGSAHVLTTVVMSQKNQIFADIPAIAMESLTRTERRNLDERKILAYLMSTCFENVRAKQFGSSTYGFGGSDTDFNILVDTGKMQKNDQRKLLIFIGHFVFVFCLPI